MALKETPPLRVFAETKTLRVHSFEAYMDFVRRGKSTSWQTLTSSILFLVNFLLLDHVSLLFSKGGPGLPEVHSHGL